MLERDAWLCQECLRAGTMTPLRKGDGSAHVDHVTPHAGNWDLFIDPANLQALCATCHSRKTATEDGGFGN